MNKSAIKNATWIVACKIIQSLLGLVIGMLTARYLGPSNYGVISYVASVTSFALPIMQLGLNHTLVKEFIKDPDKEGQILGTSLAMNTISSILSMLGSIAFVAIANAGEKETLIVCVIYSFTLLLQATEMTRFWFQSKLLSKYPSIATLVAYIVVAIYKVYLLVSQKNVLWFAFSNVLDYFLISLILIIIYKKVSDQKLSVNWNFGREMLSRSKYYIIPSLMVVIFHNTDKVMLKIMVDDVQTGMYSAAITCIGITGFVFAAIIDSARPIILKEKERNEEQYEKRMIQLYSIITTLALMQSLFMTVFSKPLVYLLYGKDYIRAASILGIGVWYITFGYYGSVRNVWILAEGKQEYLTRINVIGAVSNVGLNYFLIPIWGAEGAAIASLVTQFFTNVIIGFLFKPIRRNNDLMVKGLNPMVLIGMLRRIYLSIKRKN